MGLIGSHHYPEGTDCLGGQKGNCHTRVLLRVSRLLSGLKATVPAGLREGAARGSRSGPKAYADLRVSKSACCLPVSP